MPTRIQKWGNSLGIRIPKPLASQLGVEAGSEIELFVDDGRLVARPVRPQRFELADLLRGITKDNTHHEIDTGPPVGRETW